MPGGQCFLEPLVPTGPWDTQPSFQIYLQLAGEDAIENPPGKPPFIHQIGREMKTLPVTCLGGTGWFMACEGHSSNLSTRNENANIFDLKCTPGHLG